MKPRLPYVPTLVTAGVILGLSVCPQPVPPMPAIPYLDKAAHFAMYLVLGAVFSFDCLRNGQRPRTAFLLSAPAAAAYGGFIELLQQWCFPPRTGDWADFLADAAGALAGTFIMTVCLWPLRKKHAP